MCDDADRATMEGVLACLRHAHDRLLEYPEFETLRLTINAEVRALRAALDQVAASAARRTRFHYRVDDGPEQVLDHPTSTYIDAVMAIASTEEGDCVVEIWVPDLLPDYGPDRYAAVRNEFGNREVGVASADGKLLRLPLPA